jgi:hypothetical protein
LKGSALNVAIGMPHALLHSSIDRYSMKKIILATAALLALSVAFASMASTQALGVEALQHSGGTNSSGCHTNSKTGAYHCH